MCSTTVANTNGIDTKMDTEEHQLEQQEQQQEEEEQEQEQPDRILPKWYPKWKGKPINDGNPEVLGWTLCSVAQSIQYVGSGAFFVNTVLKLATIAKMCYAQAEQAGADFDVAEKCGPTFGSINPSSLLAMYATVIGVISATLLPLTGAVIDYTPHRRLIGRITSALFVLFQIPTIFLNKNNYPTILSMHACAMFVGWIHMSMLYAYLPELTNSEIRLAAYTKSITIWTFIGMIIYLAFVVGTITVIETPDGIDNAVFASAIGMGTACFINAIFLPFAWFVLFEKRESLHERPTRIVSKRSLSSPSSLPSSAAEEDGNGNGDEEGEGKVASRSLFAIGFIQLWVTAKKIIRNYRSLKWFYISIAFSDAAGSAFAIIIVTYMTTALKFTPTQNGIGLIIWLLGSVPAAFLSTFVARRTDPLKSSIVYIVLVMINVIMFALLTKPGQLLRTYAILFSCGISSGWKNNMDRLVSASIIPEGQDGEMMGFFLFAGQCLSWLPLVVFTAMNEAGIHPKISIVTLDIYLVIALIAYVLIGKYPAARKQVRRETVYGKNCVGDEDDNDNDGRDDMTTPYHTDAVAQMYLGSEEGKNKKSSETARESQRTAATVEIA